ncbi:unnamed protein product [Closterium sp. Naga37s-1]|nr:unnamed protein product [Closterium sp. Naga37s-1]
MGAHMQQVAEVRGGAQVNGAGGGEREGEVQGKSEEGSWEQRGWGEKGEGEGENGGGEGGAYGKHVLLPEDIYDVMLGACVQCEDWKGALAIYHHLSAHGAAVCSMILVPCSSACLPSTHLLSRSSPAVSAQPVPALLLLDRLDSHPSPDLYADVAAYTAAISACASVGQWENAIRLLTRMQQQPIGKEMGRNGKASSMPKLEVRGKQEVLRKPAVRPNVVTWTAVMSACATAGRADVAREVLRRMMREGNGEEGEEKREGEWKWKNEGTTERKGKTEGERKGEGDGNEEERVVNGRRKETRREERLVVTGATSASCFDAISDATSDCRPNVVTWTVVLTACARAGEWQQAEALFTQMQTNGVMPNEVSWAALISAYAKGGQWEKAIGALRAIRGGRGGQKEKGGKEKEKEAATAAVIEAAIALEPPNQSQSSPLPSAWNAALHACAKAGKWKLLGSLVQEMQEAGCSPSVVTYGVLVGGYGRAGQARLAREAFDEMLAAGIRVWAIRASTIDEMMSAGIT